MAVESPDCFKNKTIDNQLYTILEKMVEKGYASDIPSRDCFNGMTLDNQLYFLLPTILTPTLWTPSELGASLALWLDADDASTITLNGSNVSQWDDKSGNARHATQSTATDQPAYTPNTLNGKPVIAFDGANDGFTLASGLGLPRDMVSVSQGSGYLYSANTTTERVAYLSTGGTNLYWGTATASPTNSVVPGRNGTSTFIEQYTAQEYTYEVFLNGASALSGSVGTLWANNNLMSQIGLKWSAASSIPTWTGIIAEIVWTNSVMPVADRQKLEGYLAWKWGLTTNLPAAHPYKNFPPTV